MVLFLLHVSGLLFVNTLGVVGEDAFHSNISGPSVAYAGSLWKLGLAGGKRRRRPMVRWVVAPGGGDAKRDARCVWRNLPSSLAT